MEKKNSDQERRERRLNIVIKGVEVKGGSVREMVGSVFEKIGLNESEINVKDAFMIRGKERESMIMVKLNSMYDKRRIMEKKGKLRGSRVYVDDDMTKSERDRQREIRRWAKNERDKGKSVKVGFGRGWLNGKEYEWKSERGVNEKKTESTRRSRSGRGIGEGKRVRWVVWNVAGLKKKDEDFWKFLNDFDVVGLMETWVDESGWGKMKDKMSVGWRWKCQAGEREEREERKGEL
ncbi:hypothetical protein ALC57_10669 [Trachymyrmex cornetzi]|uniref:Endonuclease/exonuclease/phosphatase domain-containing protein n=1 Tax=Trachymyrmex cornetzi TaxID=471704 RepID=A0A151K3C9_9HYME|nr:hypothetical protein ALC57_10669 [Trachymyrmex cornetzi]